MTLDEIVARMEHDYALVITKTELGVKGCTTNTQYACLKCQLLAFRAEMEAMAKGWADVFPYNYLLRQCAAELRTKIGEGK